MTSKSNTISFSQLKFLPRHHQLFIVHQIYSPRVNIHVKLRFAFILCFTQPTQNKFLRGTHHLHVIILNVVVPVAETTDNESVFSDAAESVVESIVSQKSVSTIHSVTRDQSHITPTQKPSSITKPSEDVTPTQNKPRDDKASRGDPATLNPPSEDNKSNQGTNPHNAYYHIFLSRDVAYCVVAIA